MLRTRFAAASLAVALVALGPSLAARAAETPGLSAFRTAGGAGPR